MYVVDGGVVRLSPQGDVLVRWPGGQTANQLGQFAMATSVAVDGQGDIYVDDEGTSSVMKLTAAAAQRASASAAAAAQQAPATPESNAGQVTNATPDTSETLSCAEEILLNTQGTEVVDGNDGSGYLFNPAFGWAGPVDPSNPDGGLTGFDMGNNQHWPRRPRLARSRPATCVPLGR
jgi:hypothetical protein